MFGVFFIFFSCFASKLCTMHCTANHGNAILNVACCMLHAGSNYWKKFACHLQEKKFLEVKLVEEYPLWMNHTSWRFWKALRRIPSPFITSVVFLFLFFSVFTVLILSCRNIESVMYALSSLLLCSMHVYTTHFGESIDKSWYMDVITSWFLDFVCVYLYQV